MMNSCAIGSLFFPYMMSCSRQRKRERERIPRVPLSLTLSLSISTVANRSRDSAENFPILQKRGVIFFSTSAYSSSSHLSVSREVCLAFWDVEGACIISRLSQALHNEDSRPRKSLSTRTISKKIKRSLSQ